MARRRHRRARRYGGMVSIPGLGALPSSVGTKDVLIGVAAGFGGAALVKWVSGNPMFGLAGKVPDAVLKATPLVGGIVAGGLLYALERKKNVSKAKSHAFGAILGGASVQAWDVLKTQFPSAFGDVVTLRLNGHNGYGVFVDERTPRIGAGGAAYNGLIVDEANRSNRALAELANVSMGNLDVDGEGLSELMDMDA